MSANGINSNQVALSWTASTDDVGVAGYTIFRDGSPIGSSTGTTYTDSTVSPSTTYNYTVQGVRRRRERVRVNRVRPHR